MPWKSDRQRRAMYAAAKGKSKIGISKSGAKKLIAHSRKSKPAKPKRRR